MGKIKKIFALLLILSLLIPVTGCSKPEDAYIYFELPSPPLTLDPQIASGDSELLIIKNIHEGLLRKDADGKIVCGIAESYEKSGLTYTFKLRKNAKWSNGENITAHDFVFALRRAVNPETKAPFVSRLLCISGADAVNNGTASPDSLGVTAKNDKTLTITLARDDNLFEETLTTSVAMPCNEKFFYNSAGKYGIFADNILSSGSYTLTRWRKETFGIRLYRNQEYSGFAKAENAAVFITCDTKEPALTKLEKNSIDMAFIDAALIDEAHSLSLKTEEFQNICWLLTLNNDFSQNMRKSLAMLVGGEVFAKDLPSGYCAATSLFPDALNTNSNLTGMTVYDLNTAKQLYLNELERLPDKKFPADVVLYYYDDGNVKNIVTDIVGHWQSQLSAFVNIESVSQSSRLQEQITEQSYKMAIFPIKADSSNITEYLKKFGKTYNGEDLTTVQTELLKSNNIVPVMFQSTVIAYSPALTNVYAELGNGYIDFAYIIKQE